MKTLFVSPAQRGRPHLLSASAFLCVGIGLGLHMAAVKDFTLAPVHAHVNLLGWVSSGIMGLFFSRDGTIGVWLMRAQFVTYTLGVTLMMVGLAGELLGQDLLAFALMPGIPMTLLGVGLFIRAVLASCEPNPRSANPG